MSLFEIVTSHYGESYVRSYAWCESEDAARQMFASEHPSYDIREIRCLFRGDSAAFVTVPSDSGFEMKEDLLA